jgi:hypothetical protein
MRYDYDDKDGDNNIMSMTTISVSVHFRNLLLLLQHLLLYLSEVCCITVYKSGVQVWLQHGYIVVKYRLLLIQTDSSFNYTIVMICSMHEVVM